MKYTYNCETNKEEYICSVCHHRHVHYFNELRSEGEPFIEFEAPLLRTVEQDWGPSRLEKVKQYACPICGTLQVIIQGRIING